LVVGIVNNTRTDSSDAIAVYQVILLLMVSLAMIWALRQVMAGHERIRIRDSFYKGMYPIVTFLLVLMVIILELLPFILSGYIYGLVVSSGVAVHTIEKLLWGLIMVVGLSVTVYLVTASIFGLYIVTLPDMTPIKALRSARDIVKGRRWAVLRRLICLPLAMFIVAAAIMIPVIILVVGLTPWVFFFLSIIAVALVHGYIYTLYRELIA
jgi:hypothetical protein